MKKNLRHWLRRIGQFLLIISLLWLIFDIALMVYVHSWGLAQKPNAQADVIIVLGAGVNPNGTAGFALTRRTMLGADLYAQGYAPYIICTGAMPYNRPTSEAQACKNVLMMSSIPEDVIFTEANSRSTEENALYSQEILQTQNFQRVIVVTDSFHAFRTHSLFNSLGIEISLSVVAPEEIRNPVAYLTSLFRESLALQWQFAKQILGITATHVPLI